MLSNSFPENMLDSSLLRKLSNGELIPTAAANPALLLHPQCLEDLRSDKTKGDKATSVLDAVRTHPRWLGLGQNGRSVGKI